MGSTDRPGHRVRRAGTKPLTAGGLVRFLITRLILAVVLIHVVAVAVLFALRDYEPAFTALQLQRRAEHLFTGAPYREVQTIVPLGRISRHLRHAVVAAEDGGFFDHRGIDWDELQNAVEENERRRAWRGGSTITQQLVKNLFFGTRLRWLTKPFEYTLAPLADAILGKTRTLTIYLNVAEWGRGIYGAEAASRHYYRVSAAKLDRNRAARLAACLPAPRRRHPDRMNRYSRIILTRMAGRGW